MLFRSSVNQHGFALWQGAWLAATIVGAITLVLIIWPAIFHRKREGFPKQFQYNVPAEIVYTVVPFIIIAVLFSFTAKAENKITAVSPASATNVHDITVNGIQWSWQFTYKDAGPKATVTGTRRSHPLSICRWVKRFALLSLHLMSFMASGSQHL